MTDPDQLARSVAETRQKHLNTSYFGDAEQYMDVQWRAVIWPKISGADFSSVFELAPGHGRNTAKLSPLASEMYLVDINQHCIDACRIRFGDRVIKSVAAGGGGGAAGECVMHYAVNDGYSLPMVPTGRVTFVYSWDAVVHFDKTVVEQYVREFARIMAPGARGFIHHSNHGVVAPESNWLDNPHWRSNMTRELFAKYCATHGLEIESQTLMAWGEHAELDCLSVFRKPL